MSHNSNTNIAIRVTDISKAYRIGAKQERSESLIGSLFDTLKKPIQKLQNLNNLNTFSRNSNSEDIIWALQDVSFEVRCGEVLGIIGQNGAGKSTLLKILSRITDPTSGKVEIEGRVASLLEVGTGFHPELTGRENIYLNGTILGMRKKEIDSKLDQIIDFSGVEKFIDTPIKRYSSGMKVRLAFAVAAHLDPEILIIDEVLAVGDLEFQKKCLGKMESLSNGGRTIIFVSHNLSAVRSLCDNTITIEGGSAGSKTDANQGVTEYLNRLHAKEEQTLHSEYVSIEDIKISSETSTDGTIRIGDAIIVSAVCIFPAPLEEPGLSLAILNNEGFKVATLYSKCSPAFKFQHDARRILFECAAENLNLTEGEYYVRATIVSCERIITKFDNALSFRIRDDDFHEASNYLPPGVVQIKQYWKSIDQTQS